MTRPILQLLVLCAFAGCHPAVNRTEIIEGQKKDSSAANPINDTTPKVTGVGGIFFFADEPKKIRDWYGMNLGIATTEYGSTFKFRNNEKPGEVNVLQWAPFKTGSKYFAPSKKDFMINYRVQNLDGLVKKLRQHGVTFIDSVVNSDYGKFVHLLDPEGNKIELWEPGAK